MELKIIQPDPLNILSGTKKVLENSEYVFLREKNIPKLAEKVLERFNIGIDGGVMGLTITKDLDKDLQVAFIQDALNFCFWASKGESKWEVQFDTKEQVRGGWLGLAHCFTRAIKNNIPIDDAKYLSLMTMEDVREIFKGVKDIEIPLLEERLSNLKEVGSVLLEKFDGKFINILEKAQYDAIELARIVSENFSSFRDESNYDGEKINFFKRAHVLSTAVNYILKGRGESVKNLDKLTAFADYKLPQILRLFGVIEYDNTLSEKIDNYVEIPHDSREEIEIRSATIWGIELIRQLTPGLTAGDVDNAIWLMSQDAQEAKPYHRTRTIYY